MVGHHDSRIAVPMESASQLSNRCGGIENRAHGHRAQTDDELWLQYFELRFDKWPTIVDLIWHGSAVLRRTTLQRIKDVDVTALERHGVDNSIQQLSGFADKWQSDAVLVGSGSFTKKTDRRLQSSIAEYRLATERHDLRAQSARFDALVHFSKSLLALNERQYWQRPNGRTRGISRSVDQD